MPTGNADLLWRLSYQCDPAAATLADRHYSRRSIGSKWIMPPGRQLVLLTPTNDAVWGTSYPYARMVNRAYPGAYLCTIFRNEGSTLSSILVREALAWTRWKWPEIPDDGMITFIDAEKVRRKRDPGRCFRKAGFEPAGYTKERGLLILRCPPERFPEAVAPPGEQFKMAL